MQLNEDTAVELRLLEITKPSILMFLRVIDVDLLQTIERWIIRMKCLINSNKLTEYPFININDTAYKAPFLALNNT